MKNVLKTFALIALVAVIGFSMAACDEDTARPGGNQPNPGSGGVLPAPTGVRAETVSSTEINVYWNSVSGAYGYRVYTSKSASAGYELKGTVYSPEGQYTGADPNTTYYFKVAAITSDGREGAWSDWASARTQAGVNTSSIEGTWQSASGTRITVSGNTGRFSAFSPTWALQQDAVSKGYVTIGSEAWRSISSTGNLSWSCEILLFTYKTSSPNVCTGVSWDKGSTLTLSADGRTLSAYAPGATNPSATYTRYQ